MNLSTSHHPDWFAALRRARPQRGLAFGIILLAALAAFEIFNYSTTEFALGDLLGELSFLGWRWSTILALAFCGIDFAGIARLFTPEAGPGASNDVWYLFSAWLLAAAMNAMLTWWGVSLAILNQAAASGAVLPRETVLRAAPIFVAVMVWLIRILIIGSFSVAGERLFSQSERARRLDRRAGAPRTADTNASPASQAPVSSASFAAPAPSQSTPRRYSRPEPSYHPLTESAHPSTQTQVDVQLHQ